MNFEWPKITLVTPSYNQGRFLEQTILSVIDQDYPNLEYIVLDGGSTDETHSVLEKYQDFLSYSRSRPDQGQASAIREGLELGAGEIQAWLNSDDMLAPNALSTVGKFFVENKEAQVLCGGCAFVDERGFIDRDLLLPNKALDKGCSKYGSDCQA